jgi:hypothetical protein
MRRESRQSIARITGCSPTCSPCRWLLVTFRKAVGSQEASIAGWFKSFVVPSSVRMRSGRVQRPRVLPRDVAVLLKKLPGKAAAELEDRLKRMPAVGPTDAKVLGRAYDKQVDVCIARWDRGPELLISTKARLSSFGKNLFNRFEEAYGDAGNLCGRYPLAAVGFFLSRGPPS